MLAWQLDAAAHSTARMSSPARVPTASLQLLVALNEPELPSNASRLPGC